MTGPPGRPLRAGASVNDIMGGMFGAIGIMAALLERQRTGRGQEVQSALFENCVLLVASHMQQFSMTGDVPRPFPARFSPWSVYDVFTLAGGDQLFIGAVNDKQFQVLCRVLDAPDLANDPALATNEQRVHARPALLQRLGDGLAGHRADALAAKLEAAGLPYAPIARPVQFLDDPHLRASGGLVAMQTDDGTPTDVVPLPLTLGGRRPGVRMPLPRPGEHNDEVLGALPKRNDH
jgi:crotonobetainyl-CoA:carnitine CoA-transferase CaiB-like acyl-CoA transferase